MALVGLVLCSCSAMMNSSTYGSGDLYSVENRESVTAELTAEAEARKAQAEARKAEYEALMAEAEYNAMINGELNFTSILASDYETAYARRLYGFNSPTYRMPMTYYELSTRDAMFYATAYDPSLYNVMVSGDQVWVEPKYITSMFGSWGATNVTFGLYASPWNYGWSIYTDPFYYSWWGYPRYSWYDWNWTICYNPFYYPGYYPYYPGFYPYPGYYPGYYPYPPMPPQHRPGYGPGHGPGGPGHGPGGPGHGPGGSHGNINGHRDLSGSRYTSPTSGQHYGASDSRGGRGGVTGATSSGINSRRTYTPGNNTVTPARPTGGNRNNSDRVTREGGNSAAQHGGNFRTGITTRREGTSSYNGSNNSGSQQRGTGSYNGGSNHNRSSGTGSFSGGGGARGGGGGARGGGGGSTSSRR